MLNNYNIMIGFLQIAIILIVAIILGQIIKKMGQPVIVGELLAGILLGPSILKYISPILFDKIFPNNTAASSELNFFIQFGMILFMFVSGLKINKTLISNRKRVVFLTSLFGMIIPLLLGISTVLFIPSILNGPAEKNTSIIYAFFIGIALSISALPIIIRTLDDLNLSESEIGTIIIGSATIDDIVGWTMFACLINASMSKGSVVSISLSIIKTFIFILVLFTAGVRVCRFVFYFINRYIQNSTIHISIIIIMLMLVSTIAESIGIHPFFAAFLLGITLKNDIDNSITLSNAKKIIGAIATSIFTPLYFTSLGMKVNLIKDFNLLLVLIVLLIAFLGKIAGASIGAFIGGVGWKEAFVIGISMNSRGAVEIIIASAAVELNIIGQQMYVALIVMAVFTSLVSGSVLKKYYVDKNVSVRQSDRTDIL